MTHYCHPGLWFEIRDPGSCVAVYERVSTAWIPACAGMTNLKSPSNYEYTKFTLQPEQASDWQSGEKGC